jgi:CBS domain-containing protein
MTAARDIMTPQAEVVSRDTTIEEAARKMAALDVGALPVCDGQGQLEGMITDRDVTVRVVAAGRDPRGTAVGEISSMTEVVTIGADDSVEEALQTMKQYAVRRLPVIDGRKLVGMVSQADLARTMPNHATGELVEGISSAP